MKHQGFDMIFEDAFDQAASHHNNQPVPCYVRSWRRLRNKYHRGYMLRLRIKRMRIAVLIALSIIIGSFIFSLPKISDAIHPVTTIIVETREQIISVFSKDKTTDYQYIDDGNASGSQSENGMKTPPPPDDHGPGR